MRDNRQKLVIFDYSGTLSIGAVRFSRTENLLRQFDLTGLSKIGVKSVDVFWDKIVNPTWHEGSTTAIGYKKLMYRRIKETISVTHPERDESRIETAVSRFVDNYLINSKIDPRWQSLLQELKRISNVRVIIATDHYAEITDAIVKNLKKWRIPAVTTKNPYSGNRIGAFIVANSADIETHKDQHAFWDNLRDHFKLDRISALLVIDDFGVNEEEKDSYGKRGKVELRKQKTISLLENVFSVPVKVVTFNMDHFDTESEIEPLFLRTKNVIEHFLES